MGRLRIILGVVVMVFMTGMQGAQVIGGRLDLNWLASTAGLAKKYGTFMIDVVPALTVYDIKASLSKREHIPIDRMSLVVARQTLEDTDRLHEIVDEFTDNKIYLRIHGHKRPRIKRVQFRG